MTSPIPIRTIHDALRGSSALSGLGEAEIGKLASISKAIHFSEGTVLFNEGEQHEHLYFISGGSIRLDMLTARCGRQTILSVAGGDLLAWSALLGDGMMTATATATEMSEAVAFNARELRSLLEQDAELGYQVMRVVAISLSRRLLATRLQLLDLYHK